MSSTPTARCGGSSIGFRWPANSPSRPHPLTPSPRTATATLKCGGGEGAGVSLMYPFASNQPVVTSLREDKSGGEPIGNRFPERNLPGSLKLPGRSSTGGQPVSRVLSGAASGLRPFDFALLAKVGALRSGLSSRLCRAWAIIYLRPDVTAGLEQPTRGSNGAGSSSPLLGLAPGGGCLAGPLLGPPVVSYTTVSPLLLASLGARRRTCWRAVLARARSGSFLWPCPRVSPPGCYPAPCPVERGLSSTPRHRSGPRSPGRPTGLPIIAPPGSSVNAARRRPANAAQTVSD